MDRGYATYLTMTSLLLFLDALKPFRMTAKSRRLDASCSGGFNPLICADPPDLKAWERLPSQD